VSIAIALRRGPLDDFPPLIGRATLRRGPPLARFLFRGRPDAVAAAGRGFGLPLPTEPCRAVEAEGRAALWLGPDEWLLLAPEAEGPALAAGLAEALAGTRHSLVDIGHRHTALLVSGSCAVGALNTGCPLDLDPAAFPAGAASRTLFDKVEIVLWRRAEDRFHIDVARSFGAHLWRYLAEARQEFEV